MKGSISPSVISSYGGGNPVSPITATISLASTLCTEDNLSLSEVIISSYTLTQLHVWVGCYMYVVLFLVVILLRKCL